MPEMDPHNELQPVVSRVTIRMCSYCLDGIGGECHVPGCAFYLSSAPDISVREKVESNLPPIPEEAEWA